MTSYAANTILFLLFLEACVRSEGTADCAFGSQGTHFIPRHLILLLSNKHHDALEKDYTIRRLWVNTLLAAPSKTMLFLLSKFHSDVSFLKWTYDFTLLAASKSQLTSLPHAFLLLNGTYRQNTSSLKQSPLA